VDCAHLFAREKAFLFFLPKNNNNVPILWIHISALGSNGIKVKKFKDSDEHAVSPLPPPVCSQGCSGLFWKQVSRFTVQGLGLRVRVLGWVRSFLSLTASHPQEFRASLSDRTALVTVMHANNALRAAEGKDDLPPPGPSRSAGLYPGRNPPPRPRGV